MELLLLTHGTSEESRSGLDRYAYELINELKKYKDIEVNVLSHVKIGNKFLPIKKLLNLNKLRNLGYKADIIHMTSPLLVNPYLFSFKNKLVVTIHDLYPFPMSYTAILRKDRGLNFERAYGILCLKMCGNVRRMIAPFHIVKIDIVNFLKVNPEKIDVIHLGVNTKKFYNMNINKIYNSILFWGDPDWLEGVDVTLKVLSLVTKETDAILFMKKPFGKSKKYIEKIINEYNISRDSIVFLPSFLSDENLRLLYNKSMVYLFPSRGGFSLTLLEAMACGTPVITYDTFDIREVIGRSAFLVKAGDYMAIKKYILSLFNDNELYNKIREAGLKRAHELSWENVAKATLKVYLNIKKENK
jgi:glycosyltransferase involved in cell wall biosynthesis